MTCGCDDSCNSDCGCGSTHHHCGCPCHATPEGVQREYERNERIGTAAWAEVARLKPIVSRPLGEPVPVELTGGKLPWDASCRASGAALERFMLALVRTNSHFTDSFVVGGADRVQLPSRVHDVHFRIWVPVGAEPRLLELACIDKLTPPARVQVGMDVTPDDGRRPLFAANAGRVR